MSFREPGVHVKFLMYPVVHGMKSQQEGREVCVDEPHVEIRVAGNDKEAFFGPATIEQQKRFPEEWEAFQKGAELARIGTLLEHWPRLAQEPSRVRLLKNLSIYTVEDMAGCTDAALQKVGMGGQRLREDAQKFLVSSKSVADDSKVVALEEANAALKAQLEALTAQVAAITAPPKKRGRPAKEVQQ